jgi:hypothetical protein
MVKKLEAIEEDIKEEEKIFSSIKNVPKEDKGFIALFKKLLSPHRPSKIKSTEKAKKLSEKAFGGIEPPKWKK